MKPTFVYQILRKISESVLDEFYSEVDVDGVENVPSEGPVIIASTHHNELVDVATLTATVPHARPVSFWAKSSLFANPLSRAILVSSASIPVNRKPNGSSSNGHGPADRVSLFHETSALLAEGATMAVFPEGTSYTEPCIVQMKEGAAWAAVDYVRWESSVTGTEGTHLVIVPVGIVYTDKSRYLSRVCVKYGKPIQINSFADRLLSRPQEVEETSRAIVKEIMAEIERQMLELTINAHDWDTLYAARTARDILWGDERNIPLRNFVEHSQTLVDMFSSSSSTREWPQSQPQAKASLIKYAGFLHYTGINHSSLSALYPTTLPRSAPVSLPSAKSAFLVFLTQLFTTLLHPRAILFLPPLLAHIPAYVLGHLSVRLLATRGEEEGVAQFKAVFGGLGMGLSYTGISLGLLTWLTRSLGIRSPGVPRISQDTLQKGSDIVSTVDKIGQLSLGVGSGLAGVLKWVLCVVGIAYGTGSVLSRWHKALVVENYRQFKRLVTSFKVFVGLLSPRSSDIPADELESYAHPPPPPENSFIKRRTARVTAEINAGGKSVVYWRLIRHLLAAKLDAAVALERYVDEVAATQPIIRMT